MHLASLKYTLGGRQLCKAYVMNFSFVTHSLTCFKNQNVINMGLIFSNHIHLSAPETAVSLVY